jgi:hypothetical protein
VLGNTLPGRLSQGDGPGTWSGQAYCRARPISHFPFLGTWSGQAYRTWSYRRARPRHMVGPGFPPGSSQAHGRAKLPAGVVSSSHFPFYLSCLPSTASDSPSKLRLLGVGAGMANTPFEHVFAGKCKLVMCRGDAAQLSSDEDFVVAKFVGGGRGHDDPAHEVCFVCG